MKNRGKIKLISIIFLLGMLILNLLIMLKKNWKNMKE